MNVKITPTEIGQETTNAVNAREVYKLLKVKTKYPDWIARTIERYDFKEGEDFISFQGKSSGGRPKTETIVNLDMAKELCMIEPNDEGKKMRRYFLDMEKTAMRPAGELIEALNAQKKQLAAVFAFQEAAGEVITEHDNRIKRLELNRRLEAWQEKALQDDKNATVYRIGGEDKELVRKLHQKVWHLFKKKFHLPRYNELKVGKFQEGREFLRNLTLADMV